MTPKLAGIILVIGAMTVESFAQLSLKLGASRKTDRSGAALAPGTGFGGHLPAAAWIAAGVALYLVEIALYTLALYHLEVSVAFPLGSLCFVGVALLSRLFLAERVGPVRWLGVCCILAGTIFTAM